MNPNFAVPRSRVFTSVKFYLAVLGCLILLLISGFTTFGQTPAFPGALGFGANATGGRGGTVYHVTTLADSGTGSFRDAVSHSGHIIVFDVGGTITLNSAVTCSSSLTIAGQTAPGGGIAIIGHEVSFSTKQNEIVRFIRIRPGSMQNLDEDAINVGDGTNMIFDHVSLEFAGYNNIDAHGNNGSDAITVQNSIIGDPMSNGTEAKQGFGAHTEHVGGKMAWYDNLWVSEHNRQPLAKIDTIFVNNTEYNFQDGYTVAGTTGHFNHDIINNYFIAGPTDPSGNNAFFQMNANQTIYSSGNLLDNNTNGILDGSSIDPGGGYTPLTAPWSMLSTNTTVYSTIGAYHCDVSFAGALPYDQLDSLIISQIKTLGSGPAGTGASTAGPDSNLYYDQTSTGLGNNGYGVINGGIPATDSDNDGMPDYWEETVSLNPSVDDSMTIASDGYANIEHYLNWLAAPHAITVTNAPVNVDLWQYTGGFTNVSPIYSVSSLSNGIVSLNGDGHTASFTSTLNFFGLASFQFSVLASDGSAYTNVVTIAVVPQSQSQTQPSDLIWVGDGVTNLWAVGSGTNWFDGTNFVAFNSGDTVTFDDTGTNIPAVNLSGSISVGTVYVIADDQDYIFGGSGFLAGPTILFKTGGGTLILDTTNNFTGGTTINDGTVQIGDSVNFSGNIAGNITNNDTLIYATPGTLVSSVNIAGSGTLTKNGAGALTLSGTQTYTNRTTLTAGSLQFSGSIPPSDITNNGTLILAPSGSVTENNLISGPGSVTVNASMTLSGTNTYSGGTTNSTGTLNLANNSAAGTGPVTYLSGAVHLADGTVVTNTFVVPSSTADLMMDCVSGTGTWAGNIVVSGSAQFRPSGVNGTLVLTGTGILGNHNFIITRGTVRFASNAVFSATGTASSFDRNTTGNSAFVTIADNASVSFGQFSLGGGQATGGRMILTISDNANFTVATNFDLHNSTASAAVSGVLLNGGTLNVNGFIKTRTGATQLSTNFFNGGTLKALVDNASFLPALSGFKAVVQSGGAKIDDGGFAITIAAPLLHDPTLGSALDGGLIKLGAGTLTLATNGSSFNGSALILAGRLATTDPKTLTNAINIQIAAGAQLDVSAANGTPGLFTGQKMSGNGAVIGNYRINSAAILSPGSNSFGTLTFSNSLTLDVGSTNIFEISQSPLTNDLAKIFGALTNGGTLIVNNLGGTQLAAGNAFKLFDAALYSGTFSNVQLPALPFGLAWNTNSLNTAGTISVVLTTKPVIGSISISGNGLVFSGTGGVGNANYVLLGSTNLVTPVANWTPLLTNQFDGAGNFNFTNALGSNPQSFYLLQLQ